MSILDQEITKDYAIYNADCVEVVKNLPDNSIGFSVFSPPFSSLYVYSNSDRDMGNSRDDKEFFEHFQFLVKELYRVIKPGRSVSFNCRNLPTTKSKHGHNGIRDFRGDMIRSFEKEGFIYHSEVVIWKDPVIAMQRTKALGLLHRTIRNNSAMARQGIPDYLVTMRKPGEDDDPITNTHESFPVELWQKIASPVWMDIDQSNTLQFRHARDNDDERHIAPLQLDVIERAVMLWSKKGDTVLSPFLGIGSEGYQSVKMDRKFIGAELKPSYFEVARQNMKRAIQEKAQMSLF